VDKALLDTDILSEIFKAKNTTIVANAIAYNVTHYQQIQELGYPLKINNWR